jgi:hypothetical protein
MWLVISLLDLWLLWSRLLDRSDLWPRSGHLLLALIIQSLKKGLLSVSGGQSALQTKTTIIYIK